MCRHFAAGPSRSALHSHVMAAHHHVMRAPVVMPHHASLTEARTCDRQKCRRENDGANEFHFRDPARTQELSWDALAQSSVVCLVAYQKTKAHLRELLRVKPVFRYTIVSNEGKK